MKTPQQVIQEMIEEIEEIPTSHFMGNPKYTIEKLRKLGEHIEKECEPTGWIPVGERLPEEGDEIVMFVEYSDKSYNLIIDMYYNAKTVWRNDYKVNVTHWIPLPTPPSNP